MKRQRLGDQLLLAAERQCLPAASHVGGIGLHIEAKNPDVATWYASYGALPLPQKSLPLILSFQTICTALESAEKR